MNYWELLADLGIKYGADIKLESRTVEIEGVIYKRSVLIWDGREFSTARQIYETVKPFNPMMEYPKGR